MICLMTTKTKMMTQSEAVVDEGHWSECDWLMKQPRSATTVDFTEVPDADLC